MNFSKTISLLILLAFFAIAAGFFAFQWRQAKGELAKQVKENENLTKQADELRLEIDKLQKEAEELRITKKEITDGEVANETVGWKTYRNEYYGFEIEYPSKWEVKDKLLKGPGQVSFLKEPFSGTGIGFSLGVNIYADLFLEPEFLSQGEGVIVESIKAYPIIYNIKIGNLVYLDMCFDKTNLKYAKGQCSGILGNLYLQFSFYCGERDSRKEMEINECNKLFNQIVSTFKFIK